MLLSLLLAALALGGACPAGGAEPAPPVPGTDLVIIFDNSSSMHGQVKGGKKWDIARSATSRFIESLPMGLRVGLVAFGGGHCGAKAVASLQTLTASVRKDLQGQVGGLDTQDTTPIAASLRQATSMLSDAGRRRRIVLMTDGEESCDHAGLGEAASAAQRQGIGVFAVGFAFGGPASENFKRLGTYMDANDDKQLAKVFSDIRLALEREGSADKGKGGAAGDRPVTSLVGRKGHFLRAGLGRARRLYKSLGLEGFYAQNLGEADRFEVLEHGYHARLTKSEDAVEKLEVLKVRMLGRSGSLLGGTEGFVLTEDVAAE